MLVNKEKRSILLNVCMFICGLVVGGALICFVNANKTTGVVKTTSEVKSDYPQVYGIDFSFWQGNIH